MKILDLEVNNHRRVFEIRTRRGSFTMPFALTDPTPSPEDRLVEAYIDPELGREALTYRLESGAEGAIHVDHFLAYNKDPQYMLDMMLYKLTVEAQERMRSSGLSTREVARRLETSPSQLYRLLDQTNYNKSLRQVLALLSVLGCDVDFTIKSRESA